MGSVNTAIQNTNFITMLNHILNNISEKTIFFTNFSEPH